MIRGDRPTVAAFRPNDHRIEAAEQVLAALDVEPVLDPMLEIQPTGDLPDPTTDVVIFTSTSGVAIITAADWHPNDARICAIGPRTAEALTDAGYEVDLIPDTYTSSGMVAALRSTVDGQTVTIARSVHGSKTLPEGLREAGASVSDIALYRLVRPAGAGHSTDLAAQGTLDGALFTSRLTVEHFLAAAADRGHRDETVSGLEGAVVGAIGPPTVEALEENAVIADVVPDEATFRTLARETVELIRHR